MRDDPWRATNNTYASVRKCDGSVSGWSGWYRLFINGLSAHIPDTCVAQYSCGTDAPLWIRGGHPTVDDGVVTRDVCAQWFNYCCYHGSYPIKVKACPGNYYVYKLVRPTICNSSYCAETYSSVDPCHNYTVQDDPWRANASQPSNPSYKCDRNLAWSGWYRLFINNMSAQIPDTCVAQNSCGTAIPLWIRGGHPTVEDGVVTRDVCGHWSNYCCFYGSYPIKIKACPGNYYVYELVRPTTCNSTYCAGLNITALEECRTTGQCVDLLDQMENMTAEELKQNVVNILDAVFNASEILESSSSADPNKLVSDGNRLLKTSEKLMSMLVKQTNTSDYVSLTLGTVEVEIFMVGPQNPSEKIPRLNTTNASVDIDLTGIAKNNNETKSAAVAFISYSTMENLLKPDFFFTSKHMDKTMMSTVISATLPKTTNTKLTEPVNFTLKHIREFDPNGSLSCVYWNISEWIVDGCSVLETNSSYTVCSCVHLSTFTLIMQTSRPPEEDPLMELLNLVCVIVGLVFFSLALLTFALCQWSPRVNNVARINICISLLLAHLLFLITQQFLSIIRPQQVLCTVISGLLHFLFLSGFVWMFIEAVLLFICVKNLSMISSINREVFSNRFLFVTGYVVALVVVAVSTVVNDKGYGSERIMVFKTLAQFVVLGCSWILGFFANGSKVLEILFLIVNSQQGTFIFLIYCVLNKEVRQQYRRFYRYLCCVKQQDYSIMFRNGVSAHIPDTCVSRFSCGTYIALWIRGGHPQVEDGVVTRDVCGYENSYCCYFGSYPIKVKACPDNYYVYELVRPALCKSAYCADVSSINTSSTSVTPANISTANLSDPCYNYAVLDDTWRANINQSSKSTMCDRSVTWSGWYRLFINGLSTQIPDTCVAQYSCGTDIPLWIHGGHPAVEDGVVLRHVCGHWGSYCCYHWSYPIKVKACPGSYYVYEL
ncbi:hypothetical protein QQF64_000474, partial [Cirrhinus molitorella]